MWSSFVTKILPRAAGTLVVVSPVLLYSPPEHHWHHTTCACEAQPPSKSPNFHNQQQAESEQSASRVQRRLTTLHQASGYIPKHSLRPQRSNVKRINTQQQIQQLRANQEEMLLRWEGDEEGWRELPARAWPAYQPNPEQLAELQLEVAEHGCFEKMNHSNYNNNSDNSDNNRNAKAAKELCQTLLFHVATSLVFYNIDAATGLELYESLAKQGHVDSMVACGIVLIEGMGVPPEEERGLEWLELAVARNSPQGCYELGTVLYTGIDEVLEEDVEAAFQLFRRAAEREHTAGMYMMADCLLEGEGTTKDVASAIPLFYKAAERGHRYARQRIREFLKSKES